MHFGRFFVRRVVFGVVVCTGASSPLSLALLLMLGSILLSMRLSRVL